jgi:hypothetical protein
MMVVYKKNLKFTRGDINDTYPHILAQAAKDKKLDAIE